MLLALICLSFRLQILLFLIFRLHFYLFCLACYFQFVLCVYSCFKILSKKKKKKKKKLMQTVSFSVGCSVWNSVRSQGNLLQDGFVSLVEFGHFDERRLPTPSASVFVYGRFCWGVTPLFSFFGCLGWLDCTAHGSVLAFNKMVDFSSLPSLISLVLPYTLASRDCGCALRSRTSLGTMDPWFYLLFMDNC